MGDRAWQVPQEQFVAAWNASSSMPDVIRRLKEIAGGAVPKTEGKVEHSWAISLSRLYDEATD